MPIRIPGAACALLLLSQQCQVSGFVIPTSASHAAIVGSATTAHSALHASVPIEEEPIQVQLNEFFKRPVPPPIRNAVSVFSESPDTQLDDDAITILTAAPGRPGVPRPLWLVLLASLPTGLLWYGYYKFAIEEELLQVELDAANAQAGSMEPPRGYGGYGTLGLFSYGMLLGPLAELLHLPGGMNWCVVGISFLYYTQFLLYDRINQAYQREGLEEPLQVCWCFPFFLPFNLIVGLRQVHFLSQYFYHVRGMAAPSDPLTEFFPFIQAPRFTWQEFALRPSLWCSLLSHVEDIDTESLPQPIQSLLKIGTDNDASTAAAATTTTDTITTTGVWQ